MIAANLDRTYADNLAIHPRAHFPGDDLSVRLYDFAIDGLLLDIATSSIETERGTRKELSMPSSNELREAFQSSDAPNRIRVSRPPAHMVATVAALFRANLMFDVSNTWWKVRRRFVRRRRGSPHR